MHKNILNIRCVSNNISPYIIISKVQWLHKGISLSVTNKRKIRWKSCLLKKNNISIDTIH